VGGKQSRIASSPKKYREITTEPENAEWIMISGRKKKKRFLDSVNIIMGRHLARWSIFCRRGDG
jgi:hypothetical protein